MLWRKKRELEEEIAAHLRMAAADRIAAGESSRQAECNARRELGNELLVRDVTRDVWGWDAWERAGQDLRYALRHLRRSPGFAAVAVLTLALGLGAATAVFSVVNGALLSPLAYHEPERLFVVENIPPAEARLTRNLPVNVRHYYEWRRHCGSCQEIAILQGSTLTLVGVGEPVRLPGLDVSDNFFRTLGVRPVLGRDFLPGEMGAPHSDKVLLSDALWRSRFHADPSVVGHRVLISGEPTLVLGVMPADLRLPRGEQWGAFVGPTGQPLIFRPLLTDGSRDNPEGSLNYTSVIRLKPGVSAGQATSELNGILADFVLRYKLRTRIGLMPLHVMVTGRDRAPLLFLLGAVGSVLLIVCVNIGNLMLVRTAGRYREAGVRLALGASPLRLFSLVLMEALVLVAAGAAAGLALSRAALQFLIAQAPVSIARLDEVRIDGRVLAFALAAAAGSALLCGVVPAWRLARIHPQESLKAGAGTATEGGRKLWFRELMVAVEVALSAILLMAGGLLMISFFRLTGADKGIEVAHVITQDVSFLNVKYAHGVRRGFVGDLLEKLTAIPGVRSVGAVSQLPLLGPEWVSGLRDTDNPQVNAPDNAIANFRFVTPGYFQAMGIPLRQGRFLDESDLNRPTAVISASAARFLWGEGNPLGRHVRGAGPSKPSLEVVGVVGEVRGKLEEDPPMMVYEHFWRMQPIGMSFVLRSEADPGAVARSFRAILSAADPEMAVSPARTMTQIIEESVAGRRFSLYLAAGFAVSALALAALGIFGVISFAVTRRTPEMGIRIALGASGAQIVGMVLRQGMIPVAFGLVAGLLGSLVVGRLIASQLYGVAPGEWRAMAGVSILLLAVALCACWLPARRALHVDPLTALRFE